MILKIDFLYGNIVESFPGKVQSDEKEGDEGAILTGLKEGRVEEGREMVIT